MNKTIKTLLNKPMDRKDFLKHVGVGAVFVAGGGMILNALNMQAQTGDRTLTAKASQGYGTSTYGGRKVLS